MAALPNFCRISATAILTSCRQKYKQQVLSTASHLIRHRLPVSPSISLLNVHKSCGLHTSTTLCFHKSEPVQDLMEFFDRKETWGETSVTAGRPYRLDELRIKSNQDLHKLWYVLLKERNMLLTMEAEYNRQGELFPNPERITKVEESMENILQVVKERDDAVSLLETGKPSDPGGAYVHDFLGRIVWRNFKEYGIPPYMNKVYRLLYPRIFKKMHLRYLPYWREKLATYQWKHYERKLEHAEKLTEEFPHLKGKLEIPLPKEPKIY